MPLNEFIVEDVALAWFSELGHATAHGRRIAPCAPATERHSFGAIVLVGRLRDAIQSLNATIPEDSPKVAWLKVLSVGGLRSRRQTATFHAVARHAVKLC